MTMAVANTYSKQGQW